MSSNSQKEIPKQDFEQAIRYAFNNNEKTLSVNGFLSGKVGHKIEIALSTTNVADDTEIVTFSDTSIPAPASQVICVFTIIYTDGTREQMLSAERTV